MCRDFARGCQSLLVGLLGEGEWEQAHMPGENPQLTLTQVHRDAITAANNSWSETDKLYVSVCSALIALAAIFGSGISITIVGVFLLLLAANWIPLIGRYRKKILDALTALSSVQDGAETRDYFDKERKRFRSDWGDYVIAVIVLLMSLFLIAAGLVHNGSA